MKKSIFIILAIAVSQTKHGYAETNLADIYKRLEQLEKKTKTYPKMHVMQFFANEKLTNELSGPSPIVTRTFTNIGKQLLIIASGSGYANAEQAFIGFRILIDGKEKGRALIFAENANVHKTFVTNALLVEELAKTHHSLQIAYTSNTVVNNADFLSLSLIDLE